MAWIPNPDNLLEVDADSRLPDFVGWYAVSTGLLSNPGLLSQLFLETRDDSFEYLVPSKSLKLGKGLKVGSPIPVNRKRPGNRNDTITLQVHNTLTSQLPDVDGDYLENFPVIAGNFYTFGVTALGVNSSGNTSTCIFRILWINEYGEVIKVDSQGMKVNAGQRVRNSVTGKAPATTVGAVIQIGTDLPVTLTYPTFAAGFKDPRRGEPDYIGDEWAPNGVNLLSVDPIDGGIARMQGWLNEYHEVISAPDGILTMAPHTEARMYFQETPHTPATQGIAIKPNTYYTFVIDETPVRTSSYFVMRAYDLTGTRLLKTWTLEVGTPTAHIVYSFDTPAEAATLTIKLVAGNEPTNFLNPVFTAGITNPGVLNPIYYGTVHKTLELRSDSRVIVDRRVTLSSDLRANVSLREELQSDSMAHITTKSAQLRSDSLQTVAKRTVLSSDIMSTAVSVRATLSSDSMAKVNTSAILKSDTTQVIHKTATLQSDSRAIINKSVQLRSDAMATMHKLFTLASNTSATMHKTMVLSSDTRQVVHSVFVLRSDALASINKSIQLSSDSRQLVSVTTTLKSSVNGKKITVPVTPIPVGAV